MSSISNTTKNAFSQKTITIKIAITNKILKFRQVNNVLTLYTQISLIITTKMIGTTGMGAINSNTLATTTNIEVEAIKVAECTKISFKTITIIMMTREILIIHSHIKILTTLLVCKVISNKLSTEAVIIIQEANSFKGPSKFSSIDRVLSMTSHNTTLNYKVN